MIIKKTNTNEYDQLLVCYTEEFGKITAIARSVLKPTSVQSMHLDTLGLVEFELISGRGAPIIAAAHQIENFDGIKKSLKNFGMASFFLEVIDKMAYENDKDQKLWNFLTGILKQLNDSKGDVLPLFREKQSEFLTILGYAPTFDKCVLCSEDFNKTQIKTVAFNLELGGAICGKCFLETGRGIIFKKSDLTKFGGYSEVFSRTPFDNFFEYLLGRKISSLDFLYSVLKY